MRGRQDQRQHVDVRSALLAQGGGAYLGTWANTESGLFWPLASNSRQSVAVVGGPGGRKTSGVLIPATIAHPGPLVSGSIKPEILLAAVHARQAVGDVYAVDFGDGMPWPDGVIRVHWAPERGCEHWPAALMRSSDMVHAAHPGAWSGQEAAFNAPAQGLLAALLHAAAISGHGVADVYQWSRSRDLQAPIDYLPADSPATVELAGVKAAHDRLLGSIIEATVAAVAAYGHPDAARTAAPPGPGGAWLDGERLARSVADSLFIVAGSRLQALIAPPVVGMLGEIREATFRYSAELHRQSGGAIERRIAPVLWALDEARSTAPIAGRPALLSQCGGQGLQVLDSWQDMAQMTELYGREAEGMLSLYGSLLILPGIRNKATLELLASIVGDYDRPTTSTTRGRGRGKQLEPSWSRVTGHSRSDQHSTTITTSRERRVTPSDIARMAPGRGLLIRGHEVHWITLDWWRENPAVLRLAMPQRGDEST
jgi:type IV secretion system protein VirD4